MKTESKKITRATFKSFINRNRDKLFITHKAGFNPYTDCVEHSDNAPQKVEYTEEHTKHTMGIRGAWLVGSSRDYFSHYEDAIFSGIKVVNSCGSFIVAVIK